MSLECLFQQNVDTVVMERTALAVRSLNEAEVIQKNSFTIILHTIQSTKPDHQQLSSSSAAAATAVHFIKPKPA